MVMERVMVMGIGMVMDMHAHTHTFTYPHIISGMDKKKDKEMEKVMEGHGR